MHEGVTAVYRSNVDLFFYVLGAQGENEVNKFTQLVMQICQFHKLEVWCIIVVVPIVNVDGCTQWTV